ncbi:MAG: hypothetical protein NC938_00010 [Candidatus Omnitrophica bacterium]|nr:hypothetical protein [Candidatus Omnitrophota bacterium]
MKEADLNRQSIRAAAGEVRSGMEGTITRSQTIVIDDERTGVHVVRGADHEGRKLADVARQLGVSAEGIAGYEVGVKFVRTTASDGKVEIRAVTSERSGLELKDGFVIPSVTRTFKESEDLVASMHSHLDRIESIESVVVDMAASAAIARITGKRISEHIIQPSADGMDIVVNEVKEEEPGLFRLVGREDLGSVALPESQHVGFRAWQEVRTSRSTRVPIYGGAEMERTDEPDIFAIILRETATSSEAHEAKLEASIHRMAEEMMPPAVEQPFALIGVEATAGAMLAPPARQIRAIDVILDMIAAGKYDFTERDAFSALRKLATSGVITQPVAIAFDATSVVDANGKITNASFGETVLSARANDDIAKVVLIARSEDQKRSLEGKIEGVSVVVVNENTDNPSNVIRVAFENRVGNIAIFLEDSGTELALVERDVAAVQHTPRAGTIAYAVLNKQAPAAEVPAGKINLANLLTSIAMKGAFVGMGYDERDERVQSLARFFGFHRIIANIAKALEDFMRAVELAAKSV